MRYFSILVLILTLQSCDFLTLSSQERTVKGYWNQNMLLATLHYHFRGDKTFEVIASSGVMQGVLLHWKGTWKVMGDHLVTELQEGPIVCVEDDEDNGLEDLDMPDFKIAISGKIVASDAENLIVEFEGSNMVWKQAQAADFEKLKKKYEAWTKHKK